MANRNKITKEEATKQLLELKPNQNQNKLSQFLKQPNVKEFNKVMYSRAFTDMQGYKPFCIESEEVCQKECLEFFTLCYDYDIIPSIASLAVYLRVDKETIYSNMNNPNSPVANCLRNAVNICHSLQEESTLHGNINPVLYMFLSKNYFGMKDTNTLNLTTQLTDTTINNQNTMKIIQEQLLLENKDTNDN